MTTSAKERRKVYDAFLRNDFCAFTEKVFRTVDPGQPYSHNWHIELICDHLEAARLGKIDRLLINIPPGHMKSIIVNIAWPAWLLGKNPAERILSASHSDELATQMASWTRDVIQSDWYRRLFPKTIIRADDDQKRRFSTTAGGYRFSYTVRRRITGLGGNVLIFDDPIDAGEVESPVARDEVRRWFDRKFRNRLRSQGIIVGIMQRLRDDDLTGHLLSKEPENWHLLSLPLIAEKKEVHRFLLRNAYVIREPGDILHAEHPAYQPKKIKELQRDTYSFSAQYQQRPVPEGGAMFMRNWLRFCQIPDATGLNVYMLVDPANSKKATADYTAIWVIGLGEDSNIYILDILRDRLQLDERIKKVFEMHKKWKPLSVGYERYGMMVDVEALRQVQERVNYRFTIQELGGKLSKPERIARLRPYFVEGRIYLPNSGLFVKLSSGETIDMVNAFIEEEFVKHPYAQHDDMLDALSRLCDLDLSWPAQKEEPDYSFAGAIAAGSNDWLSA